MRGMGAELGIAGIEDAEPIGRGGFAAVYRARQPAFGRTVAVKVITGATEDPRARERFARECRAMGALSDHPGIVTVYDAGDTASGDPYLVMAHQPGGSLQDRLTSSGPLDWPDAVRLGLQIAGALAAAHQLRIIHRDVKPANVLLSTYGGAQLADFGIARIAGGTETRTGHVLATIQYAPPEVLAGDPPTAASDVYALGATLFELVAGFTPFRRSGEEPPARLIHRILHDPVPDLRAQGAPADLARLVSAMLAKQPGDRPASATAVAEALSRVIRSHRLEVTDETATGPDLTTPMPGGPADEDHPSAATVAAAATDDDAWHRPTTAMPASQPFHPTHLVPAQGMAAWATPDARFPAAAVMDPALPVQLTRWWGDWAEVRCSNGWMAWVNGRELVPWYR